MRLQYIHDGSTAELVVSAETEDEMLMLGTLQRGAQGIQAELHVEQQGHLSYNKIRAARVILRQIPRLPMKEEPIHTWDASSLVNVK